METQELEVSENTVKGRDYFNVAPGVWGMKIVFVNIYMVATESNNWVLVDAGLKGSANKIKRMAEDLFGEGAKPKCIILTHGHFDHVGALTDLSDMWHVPIYAHSLELPYLKGLSSYPPPDPLVGGGLMSLMSWTYPRKPKNMGRKVFKLKTDGTLPNMEEWRYIHTPGHAPGHISLYRESDGTLIAGDAFVTTKQESLLAVITQKKEISGPPKYFTIDWKAAADSVKELAALNPQVGATGHGKPMYGEELNTALTYLAEHFEEVAVPDTGRYVKEPALANDKGIKYIPKPLVSTGLIAAVAVASTLIAFATIWQLKRRGMMVK
ncbi:MBL fold metallo-hydrolase [Rubrolithibacter danxiaensis]|uniref:MBL fold metallo-hydrolase n=1 Tax=Rubrolithibacter danxiaensis TaxID=3390805 RepID=UPI003BF7834B